MGFGCVLNRVSERVPADLAGNADSRYAKVGFGRGFWGKLSSKSDSQAQKTPQSMFLRNLEDQKFLAKILGAGNFKKCIKNFWTDGFSRSWA
jgi:hypothetical protein